jgi:D-serine deaminase-like pyridoxal phosphate-dependent protein
MYPPIGCSIDDLDTPALCIDLERMERNIRRMAALCREHGVAWRPHSKAHKSPEIARWQVREGALGVTCAKLGEAEVLAAGGVRDLLIANMIVGRWKLARLAALCRQADPIVAVDDLAQAEPMSAAMTDAGVRVRVLLEVDIGLARVGVAPGAPAVRLAQQVARLPGLNFAGIMGYEGHLLTIDDQQDKARQIRQAIAVLVDTKDQIERAGVECPIVSAAGTGSCLTTMTCPGVTELQAGGLIFMDAFYRHRCQVQEFEFALSLIATVVSRPAADRAIIDAGRKSQFVDSHPPLFPGLEDVELARLSAEHGELRLGPRAQHLKIGDRVQIVPGYSDFTNVLHNEFFCTRDDRLVGIWPLEGRGKIR